MAEYRRQYFESYLNMMPSSPLSLDKSSHNNNNNDSCRACGICSRAKVKCVFEHEKGDKCQRCQRLERACEPSTAQDRRTRKRRPKATTHVPKSHVEKLEQKLDGLVNLIKSTQDPKFQNIISSQNSSTSLSSTTPSTQHADMSISPHAIPMAPPQSPLHLLSGSSYDAESQVPSFIEANVLLNFFREEMISKFPFVVLSRDISAEELYESRPFLYVSILTVTVRDSVLQVALGKIVMKQLAEKMFVSGERSLDLLFGILTYAGWCYHHLWCFPQLTSLLSVGLTLIYDLGLHRPLPKPSSNRNLWEETLRDMCLITNSSTQNTRTLDEQRAFLGFYFLSSVCSTFCRKVETFQIYSPYVEECVKSLKQSGENPNDISAVALVKQQIISERTHQCSWHCKMEPREVNASTMFMLGALEQELKQSRQNLPLLQADTAFIHMHFHTTEISLYEAGLCKSRSNNDTMSSFARLKLLCSCLEACKSFFEVFFSIPAADYAKLPMPTWPTVKYCITNLLSLSTFEHPDWNLAQVRGTIDFVTTMGLAVERLENVSSIPGNEKIDMFARTGKMMGRVKVFLEGKIFSQAQTAGTGADQMEGFHPAPGPEDLSQFFQFLDDTFMGDMTGYLDYQSQPVD
ncbi:hypothetical protein BKA61DRAFT_80314 [Leptodontidium sp. MPI-SDFR-AT-0119]|nr:hypothetical protein BKA61DRAFT_80314 [Leptodontidium sp. MPI-SDFR-AT-0119]